MRISLTFDDGPNTVTTPQVLDILEQYKIPASFFLIGQNLNAESSKMVERELKDGCTIENHSWTHPFMNELSAEQIKEELAKTDEAIIKITGDKPQFFRPPFIKVNDTMWNTIDLPFICGEGCEDWVPTVTAEQRAKSVIEKACDGQIVLLHDMTGNQNTVDALKTIVPALLEKGVQFMNIRDLFKDCGINPKQKGVLWSYVFSDGK